MKFVVKTLNSARHEVDIESTETVGNLKKILQERTNIEISRQKLIFLGLCLTTSYQVMIIFFLFRIFPNLIS